ncbi:MAG TPA: SPOR domain-containing protein [Ignavibacteriales bacterium]|nr:SPOR domain-containing protein [Ignavibacteriales bacterium]HPD67909.1 SPOR domain-containing protein [Ignavibacteriales bacterium]HRR17700.1 SPOR domain-containing protein [Ignavibacteriales bacterium]HRT98724.1 SPOR domain-containing protein [Ignavibacteriales bacterium]
MKKYLVMLIAFLWIGCSSSKPELLNEDAFLDDANFDADTTAVTDTVDIEQNNLSMQTQNPFKKTITIKLDENEEKQEKIEKTSEKIGKKEEKKEVKTKSKSGGSGPYVQCGAFSTEDNAMKFYQKYSSRLNVEIFIEFDKGRNLYIVRTAAYEDRNELESAFRKVRSVIKDAFIKQ